MGKWLSILFFSILTFLMMIPISYSITTNQLNNNNYNDWSPQINANEYVVWLCHDGNDDEISFYNGSTITQLTNIAYDELSPCINRHITLLR